MCRGDSGKEFRQIPANEVLTREEVLAGGCDAHHLLSAGGALRELLPIPEDRNGRHWMRVEFSVLMKFAFKISPELWSRRDAVPTA